MNSVCFSWTMPLGAAAIDVETVFWWVGNSIYAFQALLAIWGLYCVLFLFTRMKALSFRNQAEEQGFQRKVAEALESRQFDEAQQVCLQPEYWRTAVAQLAWFALENRSQGLRQIRAALVEKFQREVLDDLDNRTSWVQTVIRAEPMLGLLGTVLGMIGAFGKIAGAERANPQDLAWDISLALWTTAIGLTVATPFLVAMNFIVNRRKAFEEAVRDGVSIFLDSFEEAIGPTRPRKPTERVAPAY
jgi:biopolymer transport protein ExbB